MKTTFDTAWEDWIATNIERNCNRQEMYEILVANNFCPTLIKSRLKLSTVEPYNVFNSKTKNDNISKVDIQATKTNPHNINVSEQSAKAHDVPIRSQGSGTFEELLEALTWKRLALYTNPIVLLNTRNYYDTFQQMMQQAVDERFMHQQHLEMWSLVDRPLDLVPALRNAPNWDPKKVGLAVQ